MVLDHNFVLLYAFFTLSLKPCMIYKIDKAKHHSLHKYSLTSRFMQSTCVENFILTHVYTRNNGSYYINFVSYKLTVIALSTSANSFLVW